MAATAATAEIASFLDDQLSIGQFDEPDSNGLLVRASERTASLAAAVSASYHAIRAAAATGASLLITHHPSWERFDLEHAARKRALLQELGLSHYAAHSSLDGAPGFSNSDLLARALGVRVRERFLPYCGGLAGVIGSTDAGSFDDLVARLRAACGPDVQAWRNSERFGVVAVATGRADTAAAIAEAARLGAHTFVTGEGNMWTKLYARESGIDLAFGTHYATETFGVRALAEMLRERFGVPWSFVDEEPDIR